ncbi:MAG: HK97 family phage prohead protease [Erythrobacter sp.]|nr:HK97 family phage prohead protease [Erythrobacter sp.]
MIGQPLRFAGYAALFDVRDGDRDLIRPGAFAQSLADCAAPLPLLWHHRPDQQIGVVEAISEDARGLRVIARIEKGGSRAADQVSRGEVTGLSFGYRARTARHSQEGRELFEIDLFEISLVNHPLQHGSRVHLIV